jgi:sugar/nucleoside kinase (ribokinase family)
MTIGGATTDIFIQNNTVTQLCFSLENEDRSFLLFEEGHKITVDMLNFHTGGGATNSAISFKRNGFDVATFLKIGSDKPSEFIIQRLTDTGINTEFVRKSDTYITGHSFIFPCKNGDRTVLSYRGANDYLTQGEIPKNLGDFNAYITSLSGNSAEILLPLTRILKQHKRLVAVNPGSTQLSCERNNVYDSLANIDIFIVNATEATCFMRTIMERDTQFHQKVLQTKHAHTDPTAPKLLQAPIVYQSLLFDIKLFFKELLSHGPQIIVVTNGAEGVYIASKEEIVFHPSLPTHVVNTIGAGDAFGSCFVAKYLEGKTIKEAMLYGIINAASVLNYLDAKTGLLTTEELQHKYDETPKDDYYCCKLF